MKIQNLVFVFLSSYIITEADAQNSFSPFSFINSFLKSVPGWPLHHTSSVKQQRSTVQQLNQKTQKTSFFRPHLALGPSITHSQTVPAVVRLPPTGPPSSQVVGPPASPPPQHSANIFIGSPSLEPEEPVVSVINNDDARLNGESRNTKSKTVEILSSAVSGPSQTISNNFNLNSKDSSSGPNPGADNFPIISLIDEHPAVNYYDSVLNNLPPSTPNDLSRKTRNKNLGLGLSSDSNEKSLSNNFNVGSSFINLGPTNPTNYNPYYAPEEFTYNQDPILIDNNDQEDQVGFEEIVENSITEENLINVTEADLNEIENERNFFRTTTYPNYFENFEEATKKTDKSARSLNAKDVFRKRVKSTEFSNLVKTIEYKPSDLKIRRKQKEHNYSTLYIPPPKCKELEEPGGFCVLSSGYPSELISEVVKNCSSLVSAFQAVVPDELEGLGDTSESVITSEKDEERPWSWRVYAYKKRQACDSEVSLSRPSYAVDSGGETQLILQTASIVQRVAVDVCSSPGSACGGVAQCGLRSLCVQRFTYHYLLSITPGHSQHCPAIRAFKLPTACVCHAEIDSRETSFGDKLV